MPLCWNQLQATQTVWKRADSHQSGARCVGHTHGTPTDLTDNERQTHLDSILHITKLFAITKKDYDWPIRVPSKFSRKQKINFTKEQNWAEKTGCDVTQSLPVQLSAICQPIWNPNSTLPTKPTWTKWTLTDQEHRDGRLNQKVCRVTQTFFIKHLRRNCGRARDKLGWGQSTRRTAHITWLA